MKFARRFTFPFLCLVTLCLTMASANARPVHLRRDPPRVALPQDNAISVYVGVSAQFQQLAFTHALRQMEIPANLASYTATETIDPNTMDQRLVAEFLVPGDAGWGYFSPTTDTFNLTFDITDTQDRLSKIVVSDLLTGQAVGLIRADVGGGHLSGILQPKWSVVYYRIEGISSTGSSLFILASNHGFPDAIVAVPMGGGFEPYRLDTIVSTKCMACGSDVLGVVGDPRTAPGNKSGAAAYSGTSRSSACRDALNDSSTVMQVMPPAAFANIKKHETILDTATPALAGIKVKDPASLATALAGIAAAKGTTDLTPALDDIVAPPYSDITGNWRLETTGTVYSVLAVPFEKVKHNTNYWGILMQAVVGSLMPQKNFLSILVGTTANDLLQQPGLQQQTGLKPGEVFPLGDVYVLQATARPNQIPCIGSIMMQVTFQLNPDIAPPAADYSLAGSGSIVSTGAATTPSPPIATVENNGSLVFGTNSAATLKVAKGFNYKVNARYTTPQGYIGVDKAIAWPITGTVLCDCKLQVLLKLKVFTNYGCSVTFSLRDGSNPTTVQTTRVNGQNVATFPFVSPGSYTVTGVYHKSGPPYPPPTLTATQNLTLVPAAEYDVTLNLQ